jgi:ABC-2 type transport system ATP-binding protein
MDEAEALCNRVAIMDRGIIQALDTPLALVHRLPTAYRIRFSTAGGIEEAPLRALPGVLDVSRTPSREGRIGYELAVTRAQVTLPAFIAWSERSAAHVADIRVLPATLEEVFLSISGRSLAIDGHHA